MTNLTSEQYRDILHHVENVTEETPNVQHFLRKAVVVFYKNFGCYPDLAGVAPGKVGIFGEQIQYDEGFTLPIPTPMVTVIVGRRVPGNRVTVVTTADVGKGHKVSFELSSCPLSPGEPEWVNYIKGMMYYYCCHELVSAFEAAIESNIPLGTGFGSAAALGVAAFTFLEFLIGKRLEPTDKASVCQYAEEYFLDKKVGISDRLCSVLAKDRNAMKIDTVTKEIEWMPLTKREVVFIAIDSHFKDTLFGDEYTERSKYLKKACELMGLENLRNMTEDDIEVLETKTKEELARIVAGEEQRGQAEKDQASPKESWNEQEFETLVKRVRFYVSEMRRIDTGLEAWNAGDFETFGKYMSESHNSLKEDYEIRNPILEFLVETSLEVEGVLGSKMTGMGLISGGGVITLVYRENLEEYCTYVAEKYKERQVELLSSYKEALTEKVETPEEEESEVEEEVEKEAEPEPAVEQIEEIVIKIKRKKKCDPSAKRKKKLQKEENLQILQMEEEEEEVEEEEEEEKQTQMLEKETLKEESTAVLAEFSPQAEEDERQLSPLSFYIISPISGARAMFVLKTDLLRSRVARRVPQAKELIKKALHEFDRTYGVNPEGVGLAPATTTLFGEFLEYNMGYVIQMALPLLTVTVGGRNDTAAFRMKTLSTEVGEPREFQAPVPCAGTLERQPQSWINYSVGTVAEFKGQVPGFDAVVHTSVPCEVGLHSCAAFQSSIYEFLEGLTKICNPDLMDKAERCQRAEERYTKDPNSTWSKCSGLRFVPAFHCREGYLLLINSKTFRMANYYMDDPCYVFLFACCKERSSNLTQEDITKRLIMCHEAAELLGKDSLVNADERHIRCLRKRDASEEMIRRATYIITEQERCRKVIHSVQKDEFDIIGMLMTQSHCSLRDDFEVSCPEVEQIVNLALSVEGVLGAKLVGRGLVSSVLILANLFAVDKCIKHVRRNYVPKRDKPAFYVFKPSAGAFTMDLEEVHLIP